MADPAAIDEKTWYAPAAEAGQPCACIGVEGRPGSVFLVDNNGRCLTCLRLIPFGRQTAAPSADPGSHYRQRGGIEPIDFITSNNLDFCEGNVVKYVSRWRHKDGLADLKKARWYVDRLIAQAEAAEGGECHRSAGSVEPSAGLSTATERKTKPGSPPGSSEDDSGDIGRATAAPTAAPGTSGTPQEKTTEPACCCGGGWVGLVVLGGHLKTCPVNPRLTEVQP